MKIAVLDTVPDQGIKTKEEFENLARQLHEDFKANMKPIREVRPDRKKLLARVDGVVTNSYLRDLGALVEEAAGYQWKDGCPQISAELGQLKITNWLNFQKARLPELVFDNVVIEGEADFTDATFLGDVLFVQSDFAGVARFDQAVFAGRAEFHNNTFSRDAKFINVRFSSRANFTATRFLEGANFIGTNFEAQASFSDAEFGKCSGFDRAIFKDDASFDRANFRQSGDFVGTEFRASSSFKAAKFELADFRDTAFRGSPYFEGTGFASYANFSGATFFNGALFTNCTFKTTTTFEGARFAQCPRFHDAVLHQDTSFSGAKFGSIGLMASLRQQIIAAPFLCKTVGKIQDVVAKGRSSCEVEAHINWGSEARAYRTLKLLMSRHQAQHEASQFFAGELRCRRRQFGLSHPVHYLSSLMYDVFSEFGQSVGRVVFALLLVNAFFTSIYYKEAQTDSISGVARYAVVGQTNTEFPITPSSRWDQGRPWLALSLQSLNPIAFVSPKNTWVQVYDGAVYAQGVFQSLLNLVLLILLAISLRGQFRRGAGGAD